MAAIIPVILAGGAGTRLWPVARESAPKQFHVFEGADSMLKQTVARFAGDDRFEAPVITCAADHCVLVNEELAGEAHGAVLLEPIRRNTAPAVAAAAEYVRREFGEDRIVAIAPVDHELGAVPFRDALAEAARVAESGKLAVIGIKPTRPETGYGYIECGAKISPRASAVTRFVEKPDANKAQRFLADGNYLWNAGIVVARVSVLLSELSEHCADVMEAVREATSYAKSPHDAIALDECAYARSPSISFDYAVLEKSRRLAVVRADFAWADLGTWTAMRQSQEADANGNVLSGKVHAEDCRNVYVRSDAGTLAVIGLEDIIVVRSGDAVLIAPMSRAQEIGKLGTLLGAFKKPPE